MAEAGDNQMMKTKRTDWQQLYKGFVRVAGGELHYTRMGKGPAVVMLHASPCSAKVMLPLQEEWAEEFTCIAFDLPGFGLSEPLKVEPLSTEDLADSIAAGMRALGVERAALYGRHTGGGVAVELAHRHPDLVTMVLTDGFPVFTNPYTEERLKEYLPPIVPSWDGGHLTWTWYRYREQHIFWPWDRPLAAHRADADLPDADFLHRGTVELLQTADTYAETYASAFRHAGLKMIDQVEPPVCYGNRPGDSQFKTVKYYPQSAWVHIFPRDPQAAASEEFDILKRHPAAALPAASQDFGLDTNGRGYLSTEAGPMYMRRFGVDVTSKPLIFLPDMPGSIDLHLPEIMQLAQDRPVYAFDPAGNAHSDLQGDAEVSLGLWVGQLRAACAALDLKSVDIHARGTAAALALALVEEAEGLVGQITLISPPVFENPAEIAAIYAPDISASPEGAHLLRLWHHLRDQELWFPCCDRRPEAIRHDPPNLSVNSLQRRAILLLQQPRQYRTIWQAVLAYPVAQALARMHADLRIEGQPDDLFAPHLDRAVAIVGCKKCR